MRSLKPTRAARRPFEAWPIQFHDERAGVLFWYVPGAVLVSQLQVEAPTLPLVDLYYRTLRGILQTRREEVRRAGGLFILHDWRTLRTADGGATREYLEQGKTLEAGAWRGAAYAITARPTLRALFETGIALMSPWSRPVKLVEDPLEVLLQMNILPPPVGSRLLGD